MIIISSRKNFWESISFSNKDAIRNIDLPNTSNPGTAMSDAEFAAAITGKKLLLLIHGFNNKEEAIRSAYNTIEKNMAANGLLGPGAAYDMIIGYAWPGGDVALSYSFAKKRAEKAAPRVQKMLLSMAAIALATDVNTHSLGARVGLQGLKGVPGKHIRGLYLMAPAVDDESVENGEKFYSSTQACQQVYVFHSKFDPVLKTWFPLGDFDNALGLNGPEDPAAIIKHSQNVKVVNCKNVIKSHGGYKDEPKFYQYVLNEFTGIPSDQFFTLAE